MRKYLLRLVALGVLTAAAAAAGIAAAAPSTLLPDVEVVISGDTGLSPKALSKTKPTPVALTAGAAIRTLDGTQPPTLKEVVIEAEKNVAVDVKGFPVCRPPTRDERYPASAIEKACAGAIAGKGEMTVSVKFPEQAAILSQSPLLVFNGGEKGGVTTFYIYAYLTQPITTAIVIAVKIAKEHDGIYGLKAVASVPKIANGAGAIVDFSLKIDKKITYKGKKVGVLSAKCIGGKSRMHFASAFYGSEELPTADILRTCTPKP